MSLSQRLLAAARVCGTAALRPLVYQPRSPWLPVALYGGVGLASILWNLLGERPPLWAWAVLPASGFLLWTLLEYVLHSRFFHDPPAIFRWLGESHISHHDAPDDPDRIVARLATSLPFAVILYSGLSFALWSPQWGALALVGLIVGYLSYEVIHFAIHCIPVVRRFVRPLASHHLHHHYADPSRCYGVTSPLWDWVFHTGRRPRIQRELTGQHTSAPSKANHPSVP
jgi:4-hydroxysphinganine ceramide fatty acyl 2-hydroxylase